MYSYTVLLSIYCNILYQCTLCKLYQYTAIYCINVPYDHTHTNPSSWGSNESQNTDGQAITAPQHLFEQVSARERADEDARWREQEDEEEEAEEEEKEEQEEEQEEEEEDAEQEEEERGPEWVEDQIVALRGLLQLMLQRQAFGVQGGVAPVNFDARFRV